MPARVRVVLGLILTVSVLASSGTTRAASPFDEEPAVVSPATGATARPDLAHAFQQLLNDEERELLILKLLPVDYLKLKAAAQVRVGSPEQVKASAQAQAAYRQAVAARQAGLVIVDCNVYYGGAYSDNDKQARTWRTNENFARLLAKDCPEAAAIGMQEMTAEASRRMDANLEKFTGATWEYDFQEQGVNDKGSGLTVFWRADKVGLVEKLGRTEIDRLDNGYILRFMGVVLKDLATNRPFGLFTGKIAWDGARRGGHEVTEDDRVAQAKRLKAWVQATMARWPDAPRILTMDMNSPHGSKTYAEFARDYQDDGSKLATHDSLFRVLGHSIMRKKLDYIWYDADAGPRKPGGFLSKLIRSEHFGSDHRAVWAKLRI